MGQYYTVVNMDKKEKLDPTRFNDGLKLAEFGCSGGGTMAALAVLLANSNGRGGGDFNGSHPRASEVVGRWAGDRIVIAGDYADNDCSGEDADTESNLYDDQSLNDISDFVYEVCQSSPHWIREDDGYSFRGD